MKARFTVKYFQQSITITNNWCWILFSPTAVLCTVAAHLYVHIINKVELPYFVSTSQIESSLLTSQGWCTHSNQTSHLNTSRYRLSERSEIRWRDKTRGVTFILLSDVLIGLHIVLLLRQSLTWLTHGHGHCLSDTELEFGHLLFFKLFLKDYHWHCTVHTPSHSSWPSVLM